jgi:hypothetical protein
VEDVAGSLRELCKAELGYVPPLYGHPALPECIILPPKLTENLESWWMTRLARVLLACAAVLCRDQRRAAAPRSPGVAPG